MNKKIVFVVISLMLAACSSPFKKTKDTLADIPADKIKVFSNEKIQVSHQDTLDHYQRYLAVAIDAETRIRVSHRMAALKLQQQELAFEQEQGDSTADISMAAINDYEQLLVDYPDRPDNDALLYQLAKAYSLLGKIQLSIATLEQLVQKYPQSTHYLESEFRLGQMLYSTGDFESSAEAYQRLRAIERENNAYYLSAGYLLGWSLFKDNQVENSLLAFTQVLDEEFKTELAFESNLVGGTDMRDDILRIMAIIFAETGNWEGVEAFYSKHGHRFYEYKIYQKLADLYFERELYRSAASTLRAFVLLYPSDKRAAAYYQRLIEGYKQARYASLVRKHQEEYVQRFGVNGDYWQQHPKLQAQLASVLASYMWEQAEFYHAWGQSSKVLKEKNERLQAAGYWYLTYINSFPKAADSVKAEFLLAEALFELKDYPQARTHYEIVAYQYSQDERAAEAGYAAILSYNAYKPSDAEARYWRQLTVASAMRFVQEFTNDPRSGMVLVNTSEMLLKDQYFKQALTTARMAAQIEQQLSPRYRYGAALVRGHAAFELGYFQEAESAIQVALAQQQADSKTYKDLRAKLAASIYRQGEQEQQQGNLVGAVDHWLRLSNAVPESDIRILAHYDAATLLMTMEDYPRAIEVLKKFRANYPAHRLSTDIPSKLIVAYEVQENWQAAAQELRNICHQGQQPEQQRIACYQAAEYFVKAEDYDNAREMYRSYAHKYPKPFDPALEAHYQLDQIYAKLGDEEKRRFWLDKIISLHQKAGREQSDRSRYLAASAAFELGEFERLRFEKIKLTLPLNKSVTLKNNYLQAAQKRYTQAVQLGVLEFTTASTFYLGELYAQMSVSLMQSERPKGMDELEQEEYEFLLEEQAFPLEEAAIEIHQTNVGRTKDFLYDRWIRLSFLSLAKLMPGQYAKQERVKDYVDQIR